MAEEKKSTLSIGFHVAKGDHTDLASAIKNAHKQLGVNTVQIFCHGPRRIPRNTYNAEAIRKVAAKYNIQIVVHASYLLMPWDKSAKSFKRDVNNVIEELYDAYEVGSRAVVIHLDYKNMHVKTINALKNIRAAIKLLKESDPDKYAAVTQVVLALEHKPAYPEEDEEKNMTYIDQDSLANFLATLKKHNMVPTAPVFKVGFCIDTAHVYVGSKIPLTTEAQMQKYLFPLMPHMDMMSVLHFNGSITAAGSGHDTHAIPFAPEDLIWHKDHSGAMELVRTLRHVPIIIEWKRGDESDMIKALKLAQSV